MKWEIIPPKPGDMIRTPVAFYHHYGIFADENTVIQFGYRDNSGIPADEIAVVVTTAADFANGHPIQTAVLSQTEQRKRNSPSQTVDSALARVGETGYNILHNNCEHFAYACLFGQPQSPYMEAARRQIREKFPVEKEK